MPRKDLQEFLKERLIALDPLRDVSSGSRADTEVIQPILEYFGTDLFGTDVRSFVLDTLRNIHPEMPILPDGVLDDAVGKPNATLAYAIAREITLLRMRQRPDPRLHTVESASAILGALFVPLNEGGKAFGTGRLYYLSPIAEVVRPENLFYARNGSRFAPINSQFISKDEMRLNVENGQYYFDVALAAIDPGTSGDIPAGTLDRAPSISRAVGVTNKFKFSGGADSDSVESYLSKARNYPTQLSLSVSRGIKAIIDRDLPGQATRVEIVGMGDPDMMRDLIKGGNFGSVVFASHNGGFYPSFSPSIASDILYAFVPTFGVIGMALELGVGKPDEDYYLIVHSPHASFNDTTRVQESRIIEIYDSKKLKVEDYIVPLSNSIWWEIRRRRITISDVPGGILSPTSPDGTITIRDGEVHVGGCTDIYAVGQDSDEGTDIDVASDEDELSSGEESNAGGDALWLSPGGWIRLDTPDNILVSGPLLLDDVINDSLARPRGIRFTGFKKGISDASMIHCRPGVVGFAHQAGADHTDSWWSDIIQILVAGNPQRFRIQKIEADDTLSGADQTFVFWVDRDVPAGWVAATAAQIVRPIPDGIIPSKTMLVIGDTKYRVIDWGTGWYNANVDLCYRGEVRVVDFTNVADMHREPATYPTDDPWILVDDVDIDLSDPKRFRTSGNDVLTVAGSSTVTTTSSVNFQAHGVQKEDVLRILSGVDAGDHRIVTDPSGPGYAILTLDSPLKADGTFRFEIYGPQTPVNLPLIDVDTVNLLEEGGTGVVEAVIPYAKPLGATSSQFANAGSGLKWRWPVGYANAGCRTGMIARNGIGGAAVGPFTGADYIDLTIYSKTWGPIHHKIDSTGPYNLALAVDRQALLAKLNENLPADYFVFLDDNGQIVLPASIQNAPVGYTLAVNAFDSDESVNLLAGGQLKASGAESRKIVDSTAVTAPTINSRSIFFKGLYLPAHPYKPPISRWSDIAQVETGLNKGAAQIINATNQLSHGLEVTLYAGVRLFPEWGVITRIGSPSVGLGRTFFRDPTLFEVNGDTIYTADNGDYMPDPRNDAQIFPGSEEDPIDGIGLVVALGTGIMALPLHYMRFGIHPLDSIIPTYRDMWFTWDFRAIPVGDGPFVVPPATIYSIVFEFDGLSTVTVDIPTGSYTRAQMVTLFNAAFGQTLAFTKTLIPGEEVLAIRTFDHILRVTGDTTPLRGGGAGTDMEPTTFGTLGNLSYIAQTYDNILIVSVDPHDSTGLSSNVTFASGETTGSDTCVQFKIVRPSTQHFSAKQIKDQVHASGLYYVDVELIGKGAGNEWNLEPDQSFDVGGYMETLGYTITPENGVLSHSMREVPLMRITPYTTDPLLPDNIPDGQIPVYGGGIRLLYRRSPVVAEIQSLADSEDERENNESVLARSMRPCEIYATISYSGGPTEDDARVQIEQLIEGKGPVLDVSTIVTLLLQLGAESVETPVEMAAAYMNQDRTFSLIVTNDRIDVSRLMAFTVGRLTIRRIG